MAKEKVSGATKALIGLGLAAGVAVSALVGAGLADDSSLVQEKAERILELEAIECPLADYSNYTLTADIPAVLTIPEPQVYSDAQYDDLMVAFDFLAEYPEYSEAVFDDLEDDEGYLIPSRIQLIKNSLKVAVDYLDEEFADEVDKERIAGIVIDEDDVEKHKIYGDLDEAELTDWDWDDEEFTWKIKNKFDHDDDEDLRTFAIIDIEEMEVEDIDFQDLEE